ncbi:MAG: glycoside hydrolase family 13 protein [Anaerolineae bacterium]|nr:glycoside hydrolase family 13 protein [Anaerolineae bacterium]MDH7473875.1 glycoside hydrolase family 13 protein [Anaerolineae bacterium]
MNEPFSPKWVQDAVFYEIFPERFYNGDPTNDPPGTYPWGEIPTRENFFGGDLQGILAKLPYLQNLGISALYLTPIFKARTNHKYDTCDYLVVDPTFGSLDLLRELVAEAHHRGIRIVLDGVFNHCGDGFWAFQDVCQRGAESPYADWFIVNSFPIQQTPPNYQTCGGVSYLPKLNVNNPDVQDYLLHVATYWLREAGIDGWRLDVPWKVPFDFWQAFRRAVKAVNPEAYIVGEIWRDGRPWLQGDTFDAIMNYRLRDYILDFCVRDTMDAEDFDFELGQLRQDQGHSVPFQLNLLSSHDTPRILTVCGGDINRAILALVFQFTYMGAPMIYYGDEVGMEGDNDPLCRGTMIWDEYNCNRQLNEIYRRLIQIRRQHPALRRGAFETLHMFNAVYAYRRYNEQDDVVIVLNPRHAQPEFAISLGHVPHERWRDLLSGETYPAQQGYLQIKELRASSALILSPETI